MATGQIRQATALVRAALRAVDPDRISTASAAEIAALLGALEKLSAAATIRFAQLVRGEVRDGEHIEIDHWLVDFARGGPTQLDNLCRLCTPHHRMKTRTGWRLTGGPGHWQWLPPAEPGLGEGRVRACPSWS